MPNQYYSMILNLGYCLCQKNEYDNLVYLYTYTINFFNELYDNDSFPFVNIDGYYKKFYIICLNNLADAYFVSGNFNYFI